MGAGPLTSEVGPESETGYVFTPGTDDVTVVDLVAGAVETRLDLGGEAFVGTWDPERTKLYVPVRTGAEVAVIDADTREINTTIDVGPEPYGATAARIRPVPGTASAAESLANRIDGLTGEYETTYCIGECACGHQL
jgi:DNA-binding beta-propeller fold protein YncE